MVLLGVIPKGACIVRGKEALTKGSFGAVKSTCRWFVHAGARMEAQLLARWKQTVWTIGGKCTGSGTWQLSTQKWRFSEDFCTQEGPYLRQACTGSSKTVVCCTDRRVVSDGIMGSAVVFLDHACSPIAVEPVGRPASQLAEVVALCEACENTSMDADLIILSDVLGTLQNLKWAPESRLCQVAQISSARRALGSTGEGCQQEVRWAQADNVCKSEGP